MNVLAEIERVFRLEIDTLSRVRNSLDESYTRAAEMLFQCPGNVIVTGMGKSGLIAQKIAATMVSTGTPALFLHPGDGMHGDVGIIKKRDVVLAISKSGETEELLNILLYIKKIGVPVISITASPASALARGSDIVLFTPITEEACPLNLAPTSSTTTALVVGDALAMALMMMRGFNPEQFARLHPGGQLGKRLLIDVADVMRSGDKNPTVNVGASVREMLYEMTSKQSGAVSVVDGDGNLLGLITDYDIRRILERSVDIFSLDLAQIMNPHPTSIRPEEKAINALHLMEEREKPFLVLPVTDSRGKLVGLVHIHDLIARGL
jgi:arabinose-5-phosphate isomerase